MGNTTSEPQLNRCLGLVSVTAQAVAVVGPTITAVVNIPQVYLSAGSASWMTYLVATVCILMVAQVLEIFARRAAGTAALAKFVQMGLGLTAGRVTAWLLFLAYAGFCVLLLAMCGQSLVALAAALDVSLPLLPLLGIVTLATWLFTLRDIRLSSFMVLILEGGAIAIILWLCGVILFHHSVRVDLSQFRISAATPVQIQSGLMLAFLSFMGFESAATLGGESREPLRDIPRALNIATLLPGGSVSGVGLHSGIGLPDSS
ncbi:APC family permease [Neosynechococcus sphagnicola]|uniref:APC family permease n=1 Tax=Neosynechococcus sphagnicola TaxID=1501145 RepID=UPI000A8280E8|nr:APC family permease [Neosynechococcus sphagnicola]